MEGDHQETAGDGPPEPQPPAQVAKQVKKKTTKGQELFEFSFGRFLSQHGSIVVRGVRFPEL